MFNLPGGFLCHESKPNDYRVDGRASSAKKACDFEASTRGTKFTNAQHSDPNQITNRPFTLRWRRAINRSSITVELQVRLNYTTFFMSCKTPTFKIPASRILPICRKRSTRVTSWTHVRSSTRTSKHCRSRGLRRRLLVLGSRTR